MGEMIPDKENDVDELEDTAEIPPLDHSDLDDDTPEEEEGDDLEDDEEEKEDDLEE